MKNGKCRESDLSTSSYFTSDPMRAKPERLIECLLSSEADIGERSLLAGAAWLIGIPGPASNSRPLPLPVGIRRSVGSRGAGHEVENAVRAAAPLPRQEQHIS